MTWHGYTQHHTPGSDVRKDFRQSLCRGCGLEGFIDTVLVLKQTLPSRIRVRYSAAVDESDITHTPTQQRSSHRTAYDTTTLQKILRYHCDLPSVPAPSRRHLVCESFAMSNSGHIRHFMRLKFRSTACAIRYLPSSVLLRSAIRGPGFPLLTNIRKNLIHTRYTYRSLLSQPTTLIGADPDRTDRKAAGSRWTVTQIL